MMVGVGGDGNDGGAAAGPALGFRYWPPSNFAKAVSMNTERRLAGGHGAMLTPPNAAPRTGAGASGANHDFHFCVHLFGSRVALNAFELRDAHAAGYQFQVIGEPEDDLPSLLGRLIASMCTTLRRDSIGKVGRWQSAGYGLST
jgi:hypothetical protein